MKKLLFVLVSLSLSFNIFSQDAKYTPYLEDQMFYQYHNDYIDQELDENMWSAQPEMLHNILEDDIIMQKLDSLYHMKWNSILEYYIEYMVKYYYDSLGNNYLTIIHSSADSISYWSPYSKQEYTYYENGFLKDYTQYYVNNYGQYRLVWRHEYLYDSLYNYLGMRSYTWDFEFSIWVNSRKYEYLYDFNSYLISISGYDWNELSHVWEIDRKTEYENDSLGNVLIETKYEWDTNVNQLLPGNQYIYEHDTNSIMISRIWNNWDTVTQLFRTIGKNVYIYSNNQISTNTFYSWNSLDSLWNISSKYEYFYLIDDKILNSVLFYWDPGLNQWRNNRKTEYVYDLNYNKTKMDVFHWDIVAQQWSAGESNDYTYNLSYLTSELVMPGTNFMTNFYGDYNNMPIQFIEYDTIDNNWLIIEKRDLYYSDISLLGNNMISDLTINIYPNPANERICISLDNNINCIVELFNNKGQLLYSTEKSQTTYFEINIDQYQPGVYYLRLLSDDNVIRGRKIVIN